MSKHSKWETTRRAKAVTDAKRAKIFTKIGRMILVAVKEGSNADPETNHKLRVAIEKAKQVNMPRNNIERAIASAAGTNGSMIVDVTHEIIGPLGSGIVIVCQTDNKNRLLGEIRTILSKHMGSIAGENSVLWQFKNVGVITIQTTDYEKLFLDCADMETEDVIRDGDETMDVITRFENLEIVRNKLSHAGWKIQSSVPSLFPNTFVELSENEYEKLQSLIEAFEELDDVNEVYTNGVLRTP